MSVQLTGLTIFPVKSAKGIELTEAEVGFRGLDHDRRWMVVDDGGKFLTQRTLPKLALIQVAITDHQLYLNAPGQSSLLVTQPNADAETTDVDVWGDRCLAQTAGKAAADWLTHFLSTPCQLVYMPETTHRPVDHGKFEGDRGVSFADAYPYLLISEASLQDLNQRLDTPILMNRFRPNLVVSGCKAFAEDSWQIIRIGTVPFRVAKPCSRCTIPTVDQHTGQRGPEPLKTLATYRAWDGKIWFGQNLIPLTEGTIRLGDGVEIDPEL
ncbi:MAG: MOSC domain-containing protein [Cyanobacteria bacterium J06635_15]